MFQVEWNQEAIQQLADVWNRAPDRDAVTAASYAIDMALASDPVGAGESRPGGRRITFARPLGVFYRVDAGRRTVHVQVCWAYRTRSR